ncbi:MAG TPA: HAMP domain-containing sensor histidine kinase [Polyangia bacterium]|nr:HAMP domain-containing sensor histidine kinase [Polyangia bacterium]
MANRPLEYSPEERRLRRIGPRNSPRYVTFSSGLDPDDLLLIAAHDLRSPLAAAKLQAGRIERVQRSGKQMSTSELASVSSTISRAIDHAFVLIDDLLLAGRGTGGGTVASTVAELEAIVREVVNLQREALKVAGCRVTFRRGRRLSGEARGCWKAGAVRMIVSNLLRNVIRHAPGSPVTITMNRRGDQLRLVFSDRGPGLPGGDLEPAAPRQKHTHGLGLWIVQRAVHDLNGTLTILSRRGQGLSFDIRIPGFAPEP